MHGITRQNQLCNNGDSLATFTLSPSEILPTTSNERNELHKFPNDFNKRSSRLNALVELASAEWAKLDDESSHASNSNRRIHDRVGCSNGLDVHPGCVDGLEQIETYQFPGVKNCFVCSSTLVTTTETQDSVTSAGQHNGGCLPIEGRGHAVRISTLPSSGDSDLGQSTQDIATTNEHAGRCPVVFEGARRMDVGSYIVARKIFSTYCLPTIDLFASERSKQVNQYFSTDRRDPHALGIGALQQSWDFKNQLLYAFPPTGVIPLVLRRVYKLSSQMILVTPWWPRAPWLPELIRLSVRLPFRLPESLDTILNLTTNRTLPDYHKLHMMVWLISAQPSDPGGGGVDEPEVAGFIQNAWRPSTKKQYASVWRQ